MGMVGINLSVIVLPNLLLFILIYLYGNTITLSTLVTVYIKTLSIVTYGRLITFGADAWKVLHFDFSQGAVDTAINWAIFTDLAYSLYFIGPGLAIVMIQRWHFGRRWFLGVVLFVASHPQGIVFAIGEIFLNVAKAVRHAMTGR